LVFFFFRNGNPRLRRGWRVNIKSIYHRQFIFDIIKFIAGTRIRSVRQMNWLDAPLAVRLRKIAPPPAKLAIAKMTLGPAVFHCRFNDFGKFNAARHCGPPRATWLALQHDDLGANANPLVEIDNIGVHHPDAARGYGLADRVWLVGAVDPKQRVLVALE
jgi:hypothetical protein